MCVCLLVCFNCPLHAWGCQNELLQYENDFFDRCRDKEMEVCDKMCKNMCCSFLSLDRRPPIQAIKTNKQTIDRDTIATYIQCKRYCQHTNNTNKLKIEERHISADKCIFSIHCCERLSCAPNVRLNVARVYYKKKHASNGSSRVGS